MKILLITYDNDSRIAFFPLGLAYIASACREAGHEVKIYNQGVFHWPEEHLTAFLDDQHFDVVGLGIVGGYYEYAKCSKISKAINLSKNRPFYVLGGHGPSPIPEFFLKKTGADAVVIGEGEATIVELLDCLESNRNLSQVSGLAYMLNGKFRQNSHRELIKDINSIAFPAWDLFPMEHHVLFSYANTQPTERCMRLVAGRGCKFKCNFCYRMDKGLRLRSSQSIVEEIKLLKTLHQINYFMFVDELLMNSIERVTELCNRFINDCPGIHWSCNGRLNYAKPEVLSLMKKSGCVFVNYGIESLDDETLRIMGKNLTVKQIIVGIENTLVAGISPGFNVIFGNIGETAEILQKGVEFLLKYDDHTQLRNIRPVTPYPGSPLYYYAIEEGLLNGPEDFYNRNINSDLLTVNFTKMSDKEVHQLLYEANKILIDRYFSGQLAKSIESARKLYLEGDVSFRGFRHA